MQDNKTGKSFKKVNEKPTKALSLFLSGSTFIPHFSHDPRGLKVGQYLQVHLTLCQGQAPLKKSTQKSLETRLKFELVRIENNFWPPGPHIACSVKWRHIDFCVVVCQLMPKFITQIWFVPDFSSGEIHLLGLSMVKFRKCHFHLFDLFDLFDAFHILAVKIRQMTFG